MSDQANTSQTSGGQQGQSGESFTNLNTILSDAVSFEQAGDVDAWNDDEGQPTGDEQQAEVQQQNDSKQEDSKQQQAQQQPGYVSQDQLLQIMAQQQHYNQQALPAMIAAAVQQTIAAMGFQQQAQQQQAPVDPYAGIDPDSPDADWQRLVVDNRLLQEKLAKLEGKWQESEQSWQQQQQAAQQAAQQQQFVAYVNENVSKAADWFFKGWPDGPQTAALKEMAATKFDAEWHRNGYTQDGYTKALAAVKPHMEKLAAMRPAAQSQVNGGPVRAPGSGQRPGARAGGQVATQPQQFSDFNEFMKSGPFSAAVLTAQMRGGNNS